jgi:hypothetical protein
MDKGSTTTVPNTAYRFYLLCYTQKHNSNNYIHVIGSTNYAT